MKRILIIEDDHDIAELLKNRLEVCGYEVITAFDGEEGFTKYLLGKPHLIILDLMLPKTNGYEVCRRIRRERKDNTHILMLTAKNTETDRIVGRVKGADQYMTKPFEATILIDSVRSLLGSN